MKKYVLFLLLVPMMSLSMQDPREWKSDFDDGSWTHVYRYLLRQTKANPVPLIAGTYKVGADLAPVVSNWWDFRKFLILMKEEEALCGGSTSKEIVKLEESLMQFPIKDAAKVTVSAVGVAVVFAGYFTAKDLKEFNEKKAGYLKIKEAAIARYDASREKTIKFIKHSEEMSLL